MGNDELSQSFKGKDILDGDNSTVQGRYILCCSLIWNKRTRVMIQKESFISILEIPKNIMKQKDLKFQTLLPEMAYQTLNTTSKWR